MKNIKEIYFENIESIKELTEEETIMLSKTIQTNKDNKEVEKAEEKLIEANLKLVPYCIKHYFNNCKEILYMDLIQEGNIALSKAVKSYNYEKYKCKFSTFALKLIKQGMYNAKVQSRFVKISDYLYSRNRNIEKLEKQNFSKEEIKNILELTEDTYTNTKSIFEKTKKVNLKSQFEEDFFGNKYLSYDDQSAFEKEIKVLLETEMNQLKNREKFVLKGRIYDNKTLRDLAENLNINRETVRQIYFRALKKMKNRLDKKNINVSILRKGT